MRAYTYFSARGTTYIPTPTQNKNLNIIVPYVFVPTSKGQRTHRRTNRPAFSCQVSEDSYHGLLITADAAVRLP